jgi:pyruvate,water dikinase
MTDVVRWFRELTLADRPSAGGKGASLGELEHAGITVPPGFVLTTAAFEHFLAAADPDGGIRRRVETLDSADLPAVTAASAAIRPRLESAPLPPDVESALSQALALLGDTPVAVRSSATSEDSGTASFAGLQDTYLWVRGHDDVVDKLRRVWSSLYSTESLAYRRRLNLPESGVAMAVVVQTMVDARAAGVMFTRSPRTGDRSVVAIESCFGLGSALVSGDVTPDHYTVSKITGEISRRHVSRKTVEHVPLPAGGVEERPVATERQQLPSLEDAEIHELVAIARRVEAHYGCPQDIEWALARTPVGGHALLLLQSRPETVWSQKEAAPVAALRTSGVDHVLAALSCAARKG